MGATQTAKKRITWINLRQLVCLEVPLPPYIKEPRGEEAPARRGARQEESYSRWE